MHLNPLPLIRSGGRKVLGGVLVGSCLWVSVGFSDTSPKEEATVPSETEELADWRPPLEPSLAVIGELLRERRYAEALQGAELLARVYPEVPALKEQMEYLQGLAAREVARPPVEAIPVPVPLAKQPAAERIAVTVIQKEFVDLASLEEGVAREYAKILLPRLDPVLERHPGIYEAVYLQAQLAVIAEEESRGRRAALLLAVWGIQKTAEKDKSVQALVEALNTRGWFSLRTPDSEEESPAARIQRLIRERSL